MPIACLPDNPNVEPLKGNAKALRDLVRGGFAEPIDLVREHHPRLGDLRAGSDAARHFKLADAQLTLLRRHGFASWAKFIRHVERISQLTRCGGRHLSGSPCSVPCGHCKEWGGALGAGRGWTRACSAPLTRRR